MTEHWSAPVEAAARARIRAIWAWSIFAASIPGTVYAATTTSPDRGFYAGAFTLFVWVVGFGFALAAIMAAWPYWNAISSRTRWLASAPALSVSTTLTLLLALRLVA